MVESPLIRQLRDEVKKRKREYNYPTDNDAFVHFALELIFDLDGNEAQSFCSIGIGGKEKGIDAFFSDADKKYVYIIQGKYSHRGVRKLRPNETRDLQRALEWLNQPISSVESSKPELIKAVIEYQELVRKKNFTAKMILVVFGSLTDDAKAEVQVFQGNMPRGHEFECYTIDKLQTLYLESYPLYTKRGPDVTLESASEIMEVSWEGVPRALICNIKARELGELVGKYGFDLFQINVRHYYGKRNPVNREIASTLSDEKEKKYFWHYNLGVSGVCDRFDRTNNSLKIKNFRIVNGCQTCMILRENISKLDDSVKVMIRIIESPHEELTTNIAVCNNRQTPITGRDLFSEDTKQKELQEKFWLMKPPIFYERKTNEWKNFKKEKSGLARRFIDPKTRKPRIIVNVDAAKGYMALQLQKPAEAKTKKKAIFTHKSTGGFYEDIFGDVEPEELILAHFVYKEVTNKIKEFGKTFGEAIRKNFEGYSQEKINELTELMKFLPYSDTYITALFGMLLNKRYGEYSRWRERCMEIYEFLKTNTPTFDSIYNWLVKIMNLHIKSVESLYTHRGETFNPRNYLVKNVYPEISATISTHLEGNRQILNSFPNLNYIP
ncbi:MAG: AIPR family protein [Candidatus Freyarchaeota archaeon]